MKSVVDRQSYREESNSQPIIKTQTRFIKIMERQHLVSALHGRVSPIVVDAYVARALSRSAGCAILILPSASDTTKPIRQTQSRRVALPIKGTAGWMLAMADSATQKVRILSSIESDGCIVIDGGRDPGSDGGIELLGWVTELITHGSVPQRGGDTLAVRLELTVMMQTAMQKGYAESPAPFVKMSPVITADLSRNVCVSDDTIDFCFNRRVVCYGASWSVPGVQVTDRSFPLTGSSVRWTQSAYNWSSAARSRRGRRRGAW